MTRSTVAEATPTPVSRAELSRAVDRGGRLALARVLSAIERGEHEATRLAADLFATSSRAAVIGITGAPGSGKSSLVDQLVDCCRRDAKRVAVLAVDPSSPVSGGALLGDRVRMNRHLSDPDVFVRSVASRGALGGLTESVLSSLLVLDAVGYDVVIIETVGVGQSEIDIVDVADLVALTVPPGLGDDVQAAKAGLLELADVLVVTKSDLPQAREAARHLRSIVGRDGVTGFRPVISTSTKDGSGVEELWNLLRDHFPTDPRRRAAQIERLIRRLALAKLERCLDDAMRTTDGKETVAAVVERHDNPWNAAHRFVQAIDDHRARGPAAGSENLRSNREAGWS